MTITRTSYPERVLIVLNADGTLKGAHVEHLEILADGGDVLQSRQLPAVALNGDALAGLLPEQSALLAQVQALTDALTAANAARDALTLERDTAISERDAALSSRDAAVAAAERQAAESRAEIAALNASSGPVESGGLPPLSPAQLRLGLLSAGIRTSDVLAVIDGISDDTESEP